VVTLDKYFISAKLRRGNDIHYSFLDLTLDVISCSANTPVVCLRDGYLDDDEGVLFLDNTFRFLVDIVSIVIPPGH